MYCAKCGSKCKDGAKFCSKCGAGLITPGGEKEMALIPDNDRRSNNRQDNNSNDNRPNNKGARGLLSKKTQTCMRCGREFDARVSKLYCRECAGILKRKYNDTKGYVELFDIVRDEKHRGDERFYDDVIRHRDEIMEANRPLDDVIENKDYLEAIADFLNMPVKETRELINGLNRDTTVFEISHGNLMNAYFAMPAEYPGVVVDFASVFAVGYATPRVIVKDNAELIVTLFLTNDPYAPAFAFYGVYPRGMFGFGKNKEIREVLNKLYTGTCPNLSYPVQELKTLEKTIKQDGMVRGNMEVKLAVQQIDLAMLHILLPEEEIPDLNLSLLDRYGYTMYDHYGQCLCGGIGNAGRAGRSRRSAF